jgi:lipopolysaccharide transport system permease protein
MSVGSAPKSASHSPIIIEPGRSRVALDLHALLEYRELLYFVTVRDIKLRYRQTFLGVAWALLQPVSAMLIFSLFLGRVAGVATSGVPYPLFAYIGLVPWMFFSNAVSSAGNSLITSSNLITKVYFPRVIIPAAAVLAGLTDFAVAFVALLALLAYYGIGWTGSVILVPFLLGLLVLLALGVGAWMAGLNVKYRDIRYALPFLVQLWMFASPIVYPTSLVPERWRWALRLNPITGIVEGFRAALLGGDFDWPTLALAAGLTLVIVLYGLWSFAKMEEGFADVI